MLNESSTSAGSSAQASVGLTAFQVAVVQAKAFEKTLEEATNRREQEISALAKKAAEQRQKVRENLAEQRGGVDVVVESSNNAGQSIVGDNAKATSQPAPEQSSKSHEVDIKV
ncbi:MAG: hypothetical protein HQ512_08615 [Rhodospirillales bacterium]|nr:hypothetical protein [Rhodospirillales bacterium]